MLYPETDGIVTGVRLTSSAAWTSALHSSLGIILLTNSGLKSTSFTFTSVAWTMGTSRGSEEPTCFQAGHWFPTITINNKHITTFRRSLLSSHIILICHGWLAFWNFFLDILKKELFDCWWVFNLLYRDILTENVKKIYIYIHVI